MTRFEEWYRDFKPMIEGNITGLGAWDEPVIAKETLQKLISQHDGSNAGTIRQHIKALVLNHKIRIYPSGKQYSYLDNGLETSDAVLAKLKQQQNAVKEDVKA
jgi:hypothetical protein